MIKKENNKYWSITNNDAKNEKLGEKIKNILHFITKIKKKKRKDFKKAVKKFKNDENYECKHMLIV